MRGKLVKKYVGLVCVITLLLFYVILFYKHLNITTMASITRRIAMEHKVTNQNPATDCDTILHVCLLCYEMKKLNQVEVLVKSIMFYRKYLLHFHIVSSKASRLVLEVLFDTWKLPDVQISFYSIDQSRVVMRELKDKKALKLNSLMITALQDILPKNVSKVIALHPNVVFANDISKLWFRFNYFKSSEAIGLAEQQWNMTGNSKNDYEMTLKNDRWYNIAMMLIDLDKLRKLEWNIHRNKVLINYRLKKSKPSFSDEEVINLLLEKQPEFIHSMPCYWNLYFSEDFKSDFCSMQHKSNLKALTINNIKELKSITIDFPILNSIFHNIANMDGDIIRIPSLKCNRNIELVEPTLSANLSKSDDICEEFYPSNFDAYRTHLYFLPFKYEPKSKYDVTVALHLSLDRLAMLEIICMYWDGPVSAAVFIHDFEVQKLMSFIYQSEILKDRKNIGYHLVYKKSINAVYLFNFLRNIALNNTVTEYVFLSDVDFVPKAGLYNYLMKYLRKVKHRTPHAYVVPTFKTINPHFNMPTTKENMLHQLSVGKMTPFYSHAWKEENEPTDFKRWEIAARSYKIEWAQNFEPCVVVRKETCPRYDPKFSGHGFNKITHIIELDAAGFTFFVLQGAFVVHLPHAAVWQGGEYDPDIRYGKCIKFLKEYFLEKIQKIYGPTSKYDFLRSA